MTQENKKRTEDDDPAVGGSETGGPAEQTKRGRSSISFPYIDFSKAAAVAEAIHSNVGTGTCTAEQLGAWMKQSPKSSSFRYQITVARMFGLLDAADPPKLSELGLMLVDSKRAREARAKAFLKVPLYSALYEKFKSGVLPPAAPLQIEMRTLGVAEKQVALARQVFERCAEQTGYFATGHERLVMPGFAPATDGGTNKNEKPGGGGGDGGDNGTTLALDPLLIELLRKIPSKEDGWPAPRRVRWFRTFAMNVSQIYDDEDNPVELEIEATKPEAG